MRRLLLLASVCTLSLSCAHLAVHQLPVTPAQGVAMEPHLIAVSQQQGLEAFSGPNGAVATLEDGTLLSWQRSADGDDYVLVISLADGVPEAQHQAVFDGAKVRADQLWALAAAGNQPAPPPVVIAPAPQVVVEQPDGTTTTSTTTLSVGGMAMPGMSVTVTESQSTTRASGGSGAATCCLNGAGYQCPSAAAVDRCSGAYLRCLAACDFTCEQECRQQVPPDPSACTRDAAVDATCR